MGDYQKVIELEKRIDELEDRLNAMYEMQYPPMDEKMFNRNPRDIAEGLAKRVKLQNRARGVVI